MNRLLSYLDCILHARSSMNTSPTDGITARTNLLLHLILITQLVGLNVCVLGTNQKQAGAVSFWVIMVT